MINNVVIVSGGQQRDSGIHIYVSILPQTPLPSRLSHNIKQSSLSYMVGPCWLFILNIAVCMCPFQTLYSSSPSFSFKKKTKNFFPEFNSIKFIAKIEIN